MSRNILIFSFAALLAACGTQSASQSYRGPASLACADPDSTFFSQCVIDLYHAPSVEQSVAGTDANDRGDDAEAGP